MKCIVMVRYDLENDGDAILIQLLLFAPASSVSTCHVSLEIASIMDYSFTTGALPHRSRASGSKKLQTGLYIMHKSKRSYHPRSPQCVLSALSRLEP